MSELEQRCIDAGLKMTSPRKVILKVLTEATDHPSVEAVFERAKKIDNTISIATVYRTLGLLDELGLVVRHDFNESFSRYEVNDDGHHDHLIDMETGEVIEFYNEELEELQEKIAKNLGYELVDHRMEFYGRKIKKK